MGDKIISTKIVIITINFCNQTPIFDKCRNSVDQKLYMWCTDEYKGSRFPTCYNWKYSRDLSHIVPTYSIVRPMLDPIKPGFFFLKPSWHLHSQPKVRFDQIFSTSQYKKNLKKISYIQDVMNIYYAQ